MLFLNTTHNSVYGIQIIVPNSIHIFFFLEEKETKPGNRFQF